MLQARSGADALAGRDASALNGDRLLPVDLGDPRGWPLRVWGDDADLGLERDADGRHEVSAGQPPRLAIEREAGLCPVKRDRQIGRHDGLRLVTTGQVDASR